MSELTELEQAVVEAAIDHQFSRNAAFYTRRDDLSATERLKIGDTFLKTEGAEITAVEALIAARAAQGRTR